MLQTRFENEQFDSLTNIFTNNQSRNDFIITDRPDSAQLVDLHIYIIPKSIWRVLQHSAQNQAMDEAISAGFVRVSPDTKLCNLRESIEQSCAKEVYFPRDFIFLRSVGRCFARVKPTQENELKVKNYRPPQTLASEIYLLEGRHEDYGTTPSASPALSSASYLFGNRHQHRFNYDDFNQLPAKLSRYYQRKPSNNKKTNLPIMNTNHTVSSPRKSLSRFTNLGSEEYESSPNMSVITSNTSRELGKLKEEQERLRQRQAELERMRRAVEEKKVNSRREETERMRRPVEEKKVNPEHEETERQRRQREKSENERSEEERRRQRRRQEKAEGERRRVEQQELAATRIQASFRGFKDRQAFRERQRKKTSSRKSSIIIKESKIHINDDDELSDGSTIVSRSSIGSTSDVDSNPSRPETQTKKKESIDSIHSNSSSIKSERKTYSSSSYTKSNLTDENIRSETVTKTRHSDEEILPISTPDIITDETYELQRRQEDVKKRRQSVVDKRKAKQLEDQRRAELSKLKREDVDSLRTRLQELRTGRVDLEKVRDEVIRHLKHVHQRITLRRKEARDMWKKKYFQEKKKTSPIDDRSTQLKTDLDLIHDKVVQIIDNESKHAAQVGSVKDAEMGNLVLQTTRTQYDIQNLRHQIDQAKLKLTTDIKLRNQAENECRTLKHELTQAKMNLNHFRNRQTV